MCGWVCVLVLCSRVDSDFSLDPQDGLEAETDLDDTRYYDWCFGYSAMNDSSLACKQLGVFFAL